MWGNETSRGSHWLKKKQTNKDREKETNKEGRGEINTDDKPMNDMIMLLVVDQVASQKHYLHSLAPNHANRLINVIK